jgi:CubicO group peptidase (beta-lactamase class C family)
VNAIRNSLVLLCALAASYAAQGEPLTQAHDNALRPRLLSAAQTEVDQGFSGAVLVARHGQVLLDQAYGEVRGERMRRNTRFWISSMGKQFISAAVMRCVDLGRLSLEATLGEVWPDAPADKRAITMRQILSHTSGLPQSDDFELVGNGEEARLGILALPLEAAPGAQFIYSNANYALAAAIVERACNTNYADFVRTELIGRAGLRNTGQFPSVRAPHVAPLSGDRPPRLDQLHWWQAYYSTTRDLYRWRQALWSDRVISASARETLLSPVVAIQEGQAALGWFIGHTEHGALRTFVRGNDDTGQNSLLYYYPQTDTTIIVLTHAGYKDDDTSWSRAMLRTLEAVLGL